jgi:hypothetical protein
MLDVLKERPLLWPVDVPEAKIILVDAHLKARLRAQALTSERTCSSLHRLRQSLLRNESMYQRRELMPCSKLNTSAEKEVDAVDRPSRVERRSTENCRPSTDKAELPGIPGRKPMTATFSESFALHACPDRRPLRGGSFASPVKAEDLSAAEAERIASVACLHAAAQLCMLTTAAGIAAAKDERRAVTCTNVVALSS